MTPREAVVQMLSGHDRLPMAAARAIKRFEGWTMTDGEAYKRVMQCLRGSAGRHFELDWYPIIVRLAVAYDVPELVTGIIDEARRDALYERRREEREMRTVRPAERRREVG